MKDIYGQEVVLEIGDFVQIGQSLVHITSVDPLRCRPLNFWYSSDVSLNNSSLVVRNRSDFSPLDYQYMTDMELEARAARLEELCPDLED